jgi:hypothetical protein
LLFRELAERRVMLVHDLADPEPLVVFGFASGGLFAAFEDAVGEVFTEH